jgi:hypothetical protein
MTDITNSTPSVADIRQKMADCAMISNSFSGFIDGLSDKIGAGDMEIYGLQDANGNLFTFNYKSWEPSANYYQDPVTGRMIAKDTSTEKLMDVLYDKDSPNYDASLQSEPTNRAIIENAVIARSNLLVVDAMLLHAVETDNPTYIEQARQYVTDAFTRLWSARLSLLPAAVRKAYANMGPEEKQVFENSTFRQQRAWLESYGPGSIL